MKSYLTECELKRDSFRRLLARASNGGLSVFRFGQSALMYSWGEATLRNKPYGA